MLIPRAALTPLEERSEIPSTWPPHSSRTTSCALAKELPLLTLVILGAWPSDSSLRIMDCGVK